MMEKAIVAGNLARQPAFRRHPHRTCGPLENATRVGEAGLFIGNHPGMSDRQLEHIASTFRSFCEAPRRVGVA